MPFLGSPLSSTLVYIWSRRNPDTNLSFLGLLVFAAPYLPWVLMGFSLILHGVIPKDEIMGVIVGHGQSSMIHLHFVRYSYLVVWYFFNDVYPPLHDGYRPFDPPRWWRRIFEGRPQEDTNTHTDIIDHDLAAGPTPEIH